MATISEAFKGSAYSKNLVITYDGGFITNSELGTDSFKLVEAISDDVNLTIGNSVGSEVSFDLLNKNIEKLVGKTISIKVILTNYNNSSDTKQYAVGIYKVITDKLSSDRTKRSVIADDAVCDINNIDIANWYLNEYQWTKSQDGDDYTTLLNFRKALERKVNNGVEFTTTGLVNDSMTVYKTLNPEVLSAKDILQAICEVNGVYVRQLRATLSGNTVVPGSIAYVSLGNDVKSIAASYITGTPTYESYETQSYNYVTIQNDSSDEGGKSPKTATGNGLVIVGNYIVNGNDETARTAIAGNLYNKIAGIKYVPVTVQCNGDLTLNVGDKVKFYLDSTYDVATGSMTYKEVNSYILKRTYSGINKNTDKYEAKGQETVTTNINSTSSKIKEISTKTMKLEKRTNSINAEVQNVQANKLDAANTESGLGWELNASSWEIYGIKNDGSKGSTVLTVTRSSSNNDAKLSMKGKIEADEGHFGSLYINNDKVEAGTSGNSTYIGNDGSMYSVSTKTTVERDETIQYNDGELHGTATTKNTDGTWITKDEYVVNTEGYKATRQYNLGSTSKNEITIYPGYKSNISSIAYLDNDKPFIDLYYGKYSSGSDVYNESLVTESMLRSDVLAFEGYETNENPEAKCDTAASVAQKTALYFGTSSSIYVGMEIDILFKYANTAGLPSIRLMNSTGTTQLVKSSAIMYNGKPLGISISDMNSWIAGNLVKLQWDGSYWNYISEETQSVISKFNSYVTNNSILFDVNKKKSQSGNYALYRYTGLSNAGLSLPSLAWWLSESSNNFKSATASYIIDSIYAYDGSGSKIYTVDVSKHGGALVTGKAMAEYVAAIVPQDAGKTKYPLHFCTNTTTGYETESFNGSAEVYIDYSSVGAAPSVHGHDAFTGSSSTIVGAAGFVPAPKAGDHMNFLKGDGTWSKPSYELATTDTVGGIKIGYEPTRKGKGQRQFPVIFGTGTNENRAYVDLAPALIEDPKKYIEGSYTTIKEETAIDPNTGEVYTTGNWIIDVNTTALSGVIGIKKATATELGGIKISTNISSTYNSSKVMLDSNGVAYVANVMPGYGLDANKRSTSGIDLWYYDLAAPTTTSKGGVPALPTASATDKYLRGDGTWQVPPNTTYTLGVGSGEHASQIVLSPSSGTTNYITVPYATSAGSVSWGNVSGRPTAVSSFTNDSGYITSGGSCNYANSAGYTGFVLNGNNSTIIAFTGSYTSDLSPNGIHWYAIGRNAGNSIFGDDYPRLCINNYWGIDIRTRDWAHFTINGRQIATTSDIPTDFYTKNEAQATFYTKAQIDDKGFITGITKSMVTTALAYTPLPASSVANNLNSTVTTDALSANQGRILKEMIESSSGGSTGIASQSNNYVKFNDGMMICWGSYVVAGMVQSTSWGSSFYGDYTWDAGTTAMTFPVAFSEEPAISIQVTYNTSTGAASWCSRVTHSKTGITAARFIAGTSGTRTFNIKWIAAGKWK